MKQKAGWKMAPQGHCRLTFQWKAPNFEEHFGQWIFPSNFTDCLPTPPSSLASPSIMLCFTIHGGGTTKNDCRQHSAACCFDVTAAEKAKSTQAGSFQFGLFWGWWGIIWFSLANTYLKYITSFIEMDQAIRFHNRMELLRLYLHCLHLRAGWEFG